MAPDIIFCQVPTASLRVVNSQIDLWRIQASALPFRHPARAFILHNIATIRSVRYKATRQNEDLDQVIVEQGEALLRGFNHHFFTIIAFYNLSTSLWYRYQNFGTREDLDHIISYYRHLSGLPLHELGLLRFNILNPLACALYSRFDVEGRLEDIEESISLLRDIITLVPPGTDNHHNTTYNLALSWENKYKQTGESEYLAEAVNCYRAALMSCPLDHPSRPLYLRSVAQALASRFEERGDFNDIEDAAMIYQELIDLLDKEDPERMWDLMKLAKTYDSRFRQTGNLEYLEKAINDYRTVLLLCPPGERKSELLGNLAHSLTGRFEKFGRMGCLQEAISLFQASLRFWPPGHPLQPGYLTGFAHAMYLLSLRTHRMEDLEKSINLARETLALTPPRHPNRPQRLLNLSVFLQTRYAWNGDIRDVEEAIERLYGASKLVKSGHIYSERIPHFLAVNLFHRFIHHGADRDIVDAIKHYRSSISLIPEGHLDASIRLSNFACALSYLFSRTSDAKHLEESMGLFRSAVEYPFSSVRDRLKAAYNWAFIARSAQHSSALTAYRIALSLWQRSVDLGPTVQAQHEYIGGRDIDPIRSLPMDAASYAIESGAYEEAVEMLEQGRALLWSGMRSLRTPLQHLRGIDKALADEFTEISQALEAVITTTNVTDFLQTPADTIDDGLAIGRKDTFSRDIAEKHRLSEELEKVISRIQALSGFENFWRPAPFRHLQTAAMDGPVVIVNLSNHRSDILIVRSTHPVVHIPTPTNFFHKVTKLAHQLSETRKSYLLESKKYDRVLQQTLEELYELVGQPVAEMLRELGIPEQSRIWLCPTSGKRYLCDFYVCSYTPSLSALIASRSRTLPRSASGQPSLLIVGQPDESLPGVDSETRNIGDLVGSGSVTSIAGEAATPENVIAHLPMHPWVHFACHGVLQSGRPFESSFLLQHNAHLTLLHIAKAHLPMAELAFLAACHTAELTDDGTPDEVLHLTAAMQFSGFRSVIGTMWAMVDEDGQDLSEYFYGKMFAAGAQVASYEKSARALRHATQKLRTEKGVSLERWVNFVHYGA
ncbi:TPR-like protein [Lactifluus subvellereus]|nr:TPR-like protein [Lactifluus subvellereus]